MHGARLPKLHAFHSPDPFFGTYLMFLFRVFCFRRPCTKILSRHSMDTLNCAPDGASPSPNMIQGVGEEVPPSQRTAPLPSVNTSTLVLSTRSLGLLNFDTPTRGIRHTHSPTKGSPKRKGGSRRACCGENEECLVTVAEFVPQCIRQLCKQLCDGGETRGAHTQGFSHNCFSTTALSLDGRRLTPSTT